VAQKWDYTTVCTAILMTIAGSDPSCGTNASCPVILESDVSLTATFETGRDVSA